MIKSFVVVKLPDEVFLLLLIDSLIILKCSTKKYQINGQKVFWIFDDYSAILKNCLLVYASFKFGTSLVNATKSDFKTVNYVSAKATTQF